MLFLDDINQRPDEIFKKKSLNFHLLTIIHIQNISVNISQSFLLSIFFLSHFIKWQYKYTSYHKSTLQGKHLPHHNVHIHITYNVYMMVKGLNINREMKASAFISFCIIHFCCALIFITHHKDWLADYVLWWTSWRWWDKKKRRKN